MAIGYDIPDKWRDRVAHYFAVREQYKFPVSESDREDWEEPDRFIWRISNDFVFFFQAVMVDRGLYTKAKIGPVDLDIISLALTYLTHRTFSTLVNLHKSSLGT